MLFVALLKVKAGTVAERAERRLKWQPPAGIKLVEEYWLQSASIQAILSFETDEVGSIAFMRAYWSDLFDMDVIPALSGEAALRLLKGTAARE